VALSPPDQSKVDWFFVSRLTPNEKLAVKVVKVGFGVSALQIFTRGEWWNSTLSKPRKVLSHRFSNTFAKRKANFCDVRWGSPTFIAICPTNDGQFLALTKALKAAFVKRMSLFSSFLHVSMNFCMRFSPQIG